MSLQRIAEHNNDEMTFLKWNGGEGKKKCSKGINANGIPYDSCSYIQKAMNYYKQITK
jgi:hypothetical protein